MSETSPVSLRRLLEGVAPGMGASEVDFWLTQDLGQLELLALLEAPELSEEAAERLVGSEHAKVRSKAARHPSLTSKQRAAQLSLEPGREMVDDLLSQPMEVEDLLGVARGCSRWLAQDLIWSESGLPGRAQVVEILTRKAVVAEPDFAWGWTDSELASALISECPLETLDTLDPTALVQDILDPERADLAGGLKDLLTCANRWPALTQALYHLTAQSGDPVLEAGLYDALTGIPRKVIDVPLPLAERLRILTWDGVRVTTSTYLGDLLASDTFSQAGPEWVEQDWDRLVVALSTEAKYRGEREWRAWIAMAQNQNLGPEWLAGRGVELAQATGEEAAVWELCSVLSNYAARDVELTRRLMSQPGIVSTMVEEMGDALGYDRSDDPQLAREVWATLMSSLEDGGLPLVTGHIVQELATHPCVSQWPELTPMSLLAKAGFPADSGATAYLGRRSAEVIQASPSPAAAREMLDLLLSQPRGSIEDTLNLIQDTLDPQPARRVTQTRAVRNTGKGYNH